MFVGLTQNDFACYEPRKWKSNVYNRERLEVRQKLLALGQHCAGQLVGPDGAPLFLEASVEHPAVWNHKQVENQSIYFSRNEAARKQLDGFIDRQKPISSLLDDPTPQRNHLFLGVTVQHESLDVVLKIHPDATVDRQNLERKLDEHYEAERLLGLLHELPEGFTIGVLPTLHAVSADFSMEQLAEIIGSMPQSGGLGIPGQPVHYFAIGTSLSQTQFVAMSAEEQSDWVSSQLAHLLPIYRFIVWTRENDFVSMAKVLDKEKTVRRQRGLQKGDKVRIVRGMLAGKDGAVAEADAKGQLKVIVGKMVIKIDASDVERANA
ncbi:MAG TPA: hypothetical protein PKL17_20365 [Pseudomonadota bacterium]|nr:hypothetical protein [Pseudomonadota bacterium]HNI61684.1 hypothetical protein [Pseudomonadota bacterium]HNK47148.1 hypothetical protein [Pseudomonadota bacterium]HNN54213.1 hypothetical protein [Pseudomonadota bacterium]